MATATEELELGAHAIDIDARIALGLAPESQSLAPPLSSKARSHKG